LVKPGSTYEGARKYEPLRESGADGVVVEHCERGERARASSLSFLRRRSLEAAHAVEPAASRSCDKPKSESESVQRERACGRSGEELAQERRLERTKLALDEN